MCQQKALGFCLSLKDTFLNGTIFTVFNKLCEGAVIQIATVSRTKLIVVCLKVL